MEIKTFKQLEKIRESLYSQEFGLKDESKTFDKYYSYKPQKVNVFFEIHKDELNSFLDEKFNDLVQSEMYLRLKNLDLSQTSIRETKTILNHSAYHINFNFLGNFNEIQNPNEQRVFSILLYLKYYSLINSKMKEILIDYFDNFDLLKCKTDTDFKKYKILEKL